MGLIYNKVFQFFSSLKLTLVLLLLLLFGLLSGMFWDQTLTLEDHLSNLKESEVTKQLFLFFEGYDVFHAWWFSVLVLLLALNLIACSIERLPKIWIAIQNPKRLIDENMFTRMPYHFRAKLTRASFEKWLSANFKKQTPFFEDNNTSFYFFEKHKYARTGVYVVHTALLMIMFGSILTTNLGIDGMMVIKEGEGESKVQLKGPGGLAYLHELDFTVKCDDFRLRTFIDDSPLAYESDLSISSNDKKELYASQTVKLNHPLYFAGYNFYQASYQPLSLDTTVKIKIAPHSKEGKVYQIPLGEKITLPDKTTIRAVEIVEDYGGLGEALKIQEVSIESIRTNYVVFRQYPEFDPEVRRGKWDVFFQGFDQVYATGISVGKVPFVSLVFLGFCVLFVGLFMAFYMSHRRYYIRVDKQEANYDVWFAASVRRHKQSFSKEFKNLTERMKT